MVAFSSFAKPHLCCPNVQLLVLWFMYLLFSLYRLNFTWINIFLFSPNLPTAAAILFRCCFVLSTALIWLALCECLCLLTNQNTLFFSLFCTELPIFCTKLPYFCIVFPKNCITLSQSESRNFCMYIIINITTTIRRVFCRVLKNMCSYRKQMQLLAKQHQRSISSILRFKLVSVTLEEAFGSLFSARNIFRSF